MAKLQPPPAKASWRKSRASSGPEGSCLELTGTHEGYWVRDSKNPRGPVLGCPRQGWAVFLVAVQRGDFDRFANAGLTGNAEDHD